MAGLRWVRLLERAGRAGSGRGVGSLEGLAGLFLKNSGCGIRSLCSSSLPMSLSCPRTEIGVDAERFGDSRTARGWRVE